MYFLSKQTRPVSYSALKEALPDMVESTLVRNLIRLVKDKKITKTTSWKNTFYQIAHMPYEDILQYIESPFFTRPAKSYSFGFLESYIPNVTSFLWDRKTQLHDAVASVQTLSTNDYQSNRRGLESAIIDISYSSSKLEGNTYSYLDTEVLVKANEIAAGKTKDDTQMIINHKNAIVHIIEHRGKLTPTFATFSDIHRILWEKLIPDHTLWVIRKTPVTIGGSSYTPLDNTHQLSDVAVMFFEKLQKIKDPFEQSLFILVFVPYFQLFIDINKRTSRLSANIPLVQHGLPIISLLQATEREYISAILAVYELQDVRLLRDLYVDNYILNMKRYIA
jgi:Fic family protein